MQELQVVARTCRLIIIKFNVSNISARILVLQPTGITASNDPYSAGILICGSLLMNWKGSATAKAKH